MLAALVLAALVAQSATFGVPDPSFFVVRVEKVAHAHFRATFVPLP